MKNKLLLPVSLLLSMFFYCCATTSNVTPVNVKPIFIENLKNLTIQPGIETELTSKIIDEVLRDGGFKIVDSSIAELKLSGEISDYYLNPSLYNQNNEVEEYIMGIKLSFNIQKGTETKTEVVTNETRYYTSLKEYGTFDAVKEQNLKSAAISENLDYIARQVLSRIR